jgi:hypothetical protein
MVFMMVIILILGQLRNELLLIDWSFLESYEDVDLACHGFYNKLFELFDLIVPKKRKSRHNYPPWLSYELIKKIKLKHRILKKFRVSGKLCDLEKYRMLRRDIKINTLLKLRLT